MKNISILDCTLRDGGYCNQWEFGEENIQRIVRALVEANIDIIECGFVTQQASDDRNKTKFNSVKAVENVIPQNRDGKLFVCMINYGEFPLQNITPYDGNSVDGIRVAFHKKEMPEAIKYCQGLKEKGYKVFLQPMATLNYSEEEFIELIKLTNKIGPYAFYIVDSFGGMKERDLIRLFYIVENRLADGIQIGFHSHNNMQLAYSNARTLTSVKTKRQLIIDSSIYGMGRGAGNLNTELLVEYLNDMETTPYNLHPVLLVIDQILNKFYQKNYWGYSIPNYLSAGHNAHPNYANYLMDRQTLLIEDMDQIFAMMSEDKKGNYDRAYIEELYYRYMENGKCYEEHLNEFKSELKNKKVLIIAPGKSIEDERENVINFVNQDGVITISINFEYHLIKTDYIFVSNLRRYSELDSGVYRKCILTSNIPAEKGYMKIRYSSLLNNIEEVRDNAGLMLIQLLINLGVKEIAIAGMDGYSYDADSNYADDSMSFITKHTVLDARNRGMEIMLERYKAQADLNFITASKFMSRAKGKIK